MSVEKSKNEKKILEKTVYLQYAGKEVSIDTVEKAVKENYDSVKKGKDQAPLGAHW